ncbi:MAG: hypothetical protein WC821_05300 [archaeon]|jgi:hypothetical protein
MPKQIKTKPMVSKEITQKEFLARIKKRRAPAIPKVTLKKIKSTANHLKEILKNSGLGDNELRKIFGKTKLSQEEVLEIAKKIKPSYYSYLSPFQSTLGRFSNIESLLQSCVGLRMAREFAKGKK